MWRRSRRAERAPAQATPEAASERAPAVAAAREPHGPVAAGEERAPESAGRGLGVTQASTAPAARPGVPRERRRGWRAREAGAATAGAVGSGVLAFARLVLLAATLIALLIGLAIVLVDVDANRTNSIVEGIHEGANFFAGAFTGLIEFSGHPKRAITVDWGIALLAYLLVGALIARMIASVGRSSVGFGQRHRAAPMH